jgi:hypothetical protein
MIGTPPRRDDQVRNVSLVSHDIEHIQHVHDGEDDEYAVEMGYGE